MPKEEKDFYIKLLGFCNSLQKEFTYSELEKNILNNDWEKNITKNYLKNAWKNRQSLEQSKYSDYDTIFLCTHRGLGGGIDDSTAENSKYILNYEAKFNYIDYQELNEARKTSKQALITSTIAIGIAIITLIISIFFSILNLNTPTKVDSQQFQEIKNLINK